MVIKIGMLECWNNAGLLIFFSSIIPQFHSSILPLFSAQWVQFKATFLEGGFLLVG